MLNHAMQGVRQLINHNKHPHNTADANPFGKALDTPDDIVDELTRNAIKLNPRICASSAAFCLLKTGL